MAKLLKFPDRKRQLSQAEAQRRWLEHNEIPVVQKWNWPRSTWFQLRLGAVQAIRRMHGW